MKVMDLVESINRLVPGSYYPNEFPTDSADDCNIVILQGGSDYNIQISKPSFQVIIRAVHPATAEARAWEIFDNLKFKRNFNVGMSHVILCKPEQSTPLYIGTDDKGLFLYSVNFNTIVEPIN